MESAHALNHTLVDVGLADAGSVLGQPVDLPRAVDRFELLAGFAGIEEEQHGDALQGADFDRRRGGGAQRLRQATRGDRRMAAMAI